MSPTFTPAKFDDSSLYRFAKFPWPEPAPSKDEVRRHSWGMTYKHNKAFATPLGVENINARAVKYYKASLEQNWGGSPVPRKRIRLLMPCLRATSMWKMTCFYRSHMQ